MKVLLLLPCVLALTAAPVANGYPNGPPVSACTSMYPTGHRVDAQTSDPPYELVISNNTYEPGQEITVTLQMKAGHDAAYPYFEGMFVQARLADCGSNDSVGTFAVPDDGFLRVMNCHGRTNSAVSHKDHSHETMKTFTWTAPSSGSGRIYFRATVVKNTETFWTNVFSEYVEDSMDNSAVPQTYCDVQSTVGIGSASSLAAVTSLVVAAVVTSLQFF